MTKAIIINIKEDMTGFKYPACSKCHAAISIVKMNNTSIEIADFKSAKYCPYCGSKFIKKMGKE